MEHEAATIATPAHPPATRAAEAPPPDLPLAGEESTGTLRLNQLPLLVLTGPAVAARPLTLELARVDGLEQRAIEHEVGGIVGRPESISGMRLTLSDDGLDRAAGLVALGADHSYGCLGADGVSLGDATRYAARLERLGLRAETSWQDLAEGYYVLDAEPWNLRRLVDQPAIWAAERYLEAVPGGQDVSLVLLGPTCTTLS